MLVIDSVLLDFQDERDDNELLDDYATIDRGRRVIFAEKGVAFPSLSDNYGEQFRLMSLGMVFIVKRAIINLIPNKTPDITKELVVVKRVNSPFVKTTSSRASLSIKHNVFNQTYQKKSTFEDAKEAKNIYRLILKLLSKNGYNRITFKYDRKGVCTYDYI